MTKKQAMTVMAVLMAVLTFAQDKAADPVPTLTLDEKKALLIDELTLQDKLQKAQSSAAFQAAQAEIQQAQKDFEADAKPIRDDEEKVKAAIAKEHPGWHVEQGPQGFTLAKDPPKPPAKK